MSLPETNDIGYSKSRLSTRAEQLRGKKYLLVHGTLDDNVHYQQAMILAKNLERHDILFKQIVSQTIHLYISRIRIHLFFTPCRAMPTRITDWPMCVRIYIIRWIASLANASPAVAS